MKRLLQTGLAVLAAVLWPAPAHAGMPSIFLSDLATIRLESISFFLAILLLAAYVVKRLWNFYRRDFPNLPELDYKKSLGLVVLWGLAFHLVLGMVTGTRELMTPKAWKREGVTYKIREQVKKDWKGHDIVLVQLRKQRLDALRRALWSYAQSHQGKFPPDGQVAEIPQDTWKVLQESNLKFNYVKGLKADIGNTPVAYEPGIYGEQRYVLFTDGAIEHMPVDRILAAVNGNHK